MDYDLEIRRFHQPKIISDLGLALSLFGKLCKVGKIGRAVKRILKKLKCNLFDLFVFFGNNFGEFVHHRKRRNKNDVTYMETGVCRQHYSMNHRLIYIHGDRCLQTTLFYE